MTITADAKWRFPFPVFLPWSLSALFFSLSFATSLFHFPLSDRFGWGCQWADLHSTSISHAKIRMTEWLYLNEWQREEREREGKIEGCYDMLSSMIMLSNEPLIFAPVLGSRALLSCLLSPSSSLRSPVWYPFFMLRIARLDDSPPPLLIDYIIRHKQNDGPNVCSVHRIDWIAVFIDRWFP